MGGLFTPANWGVYVSTKHALNRWPRRCSRNWRPYGIKVQTINPGAFYTGYNETMADTPFRWLDDAKNVTKRADLRKAFELSSVHLTAISMPQEMIDRMIEIVPADAGKFRNVVPKATEDMLKAHQLAAWDEPDLRHPHGLCQPKIVLVTGASSGFGRLSANALAHGGSHRLRIDARTASCNASQVADVAAYAREQGVDLRTIDLDVSSQASSIRRRRDHHRATAASTSSCTMPDTPPSARPKPSRPSNSPSFTTSLCSPPSASIAPSCRTCAGAAADF